MPQSFHSRRRIRLLMLALGLASVAALACRRAPDPRPTGDAVMFGSIKELMDGLIDPTADLLFDAVSYDITAAGITEHKPTTREDWAELRRHALLLAEATNLLRMPGRRVAPDRPVLEFESDEPSPEDLSPDQIQALIDEDRAAFDRLAQGLADAAVETLRAIDAMNVEALFASGDSIDNACEACHAKYWYPKDKTPALDALSRRKK